MSRAIVLLCLLALTGPAARVAAQRQTPQEIRGRVVASENGSALPRVRLTVLGVGAGASVEPVLSDDRGRFLLQLSESTARAPIWLRATKAGFATAAIEVTRAGLSSGRELEVRLARGGAISGRVVNMVGGPMASSVVIIRSSSAAARRVTPVAVQTDDLGEYRIGGLPEGRYSLQVAEVPFVSMPDLASLVLTPGVGPFTDPLGRFNEQLQNGQENPSPAISEAVTVTIRAGDDLAAPDLTVNPQARGSCPASAEPSEADAAGTAAIRGRVLNGSGRPLSCARVALVPSSGAGMAVRQSDAAGRFTFSGVRAGTYGLDVSKPAYAPGRYAQTPANPQGRVITLREGEASDRLDVVLGRRPAMIGTVLDEQGEPVVGVRVRALQLRMTGDLTMVVNAPGVAVRPTDDRGQFRLFGFVPGMYLIGTTIDGSVAGPEGSFGYPPIFHPGSTSVATASPLEVGGSDVTGVNLVLVRSPTRRVSGFAFDSSGRPAPEVAVFPSVRSTGILHEPRRAAVGADGAFTMSNLPPGEYVVQVVAKAPGRSWAPAEFGMQYVTVADRDPEPVIVRTAAGAIIEGELIGRSDVPIESVLFENELRLSPLPTDVDRSPLTANVRRGFVTFDGARFTIDGVMGSGRFVLPRPPDGWYLQSVTVNGRDALNRPFDFGMRGDRFTGVEAVLSNGAAAVTGRVLDASGSAAPTAAVMVFTTDRSLWFRESQHVAVGRPGRDGVIRVGNLPPGEYFVAPFEPSDGGTFRVIEWHDTTLLDALASRAERITLGEREVYRGTFRLMGQR